MFGLSEIQDKRMQIEELYNASKSALNNNNLQIAQKTIKQSIRIAEEVYNTTKSYDDEEMLLNLYVEMGKFYYAVYEITNDKNDLRPAVIYFEKIIYFYLEELEDVKRERQIILTRKLLEILVHLIFLSDELDDKRLFNKVKKPLYKNAKKLYNLTKTYDDEQYLIIYYMYSGKRYEKDAKYKRAYISYRIAIHKVSVIYNAIPKEEIKNDLIELYLDIYNIAKNFKIEKISRKWLDKLKELGVRK